MKLKRRGILAFLSACLPVLLARRSVARVPPVDSALTDHPGPGRGRIRRHPYGCCWTCALMNNEPGLFSPLPDGESLPLPEQAQDDDGLFFPAFMVAARDARMAR